MHDPMVVAHQVPLPVPQRYRHGDIDAKRYGSTGLYRRRRTNPQNWGEPVYRWWRPAGWRLFVAGRAYRMPVLAIVWYVEPGDRDALSVCSTWKDGRRTTGWRWHVHHWRVQPLPYRPRRGADVMARADA